MKLTLVTDRNRVYDIYLRIYELLNIEKTPNTTNSMTLRFDSIHYWKMRWLLAWCQYYIHCSYSYPICACPDWYILTSTRVHCSGHRLTSDEIIITYFVVTYVIFRRCLWISEHGIDVFDNDVSRIQYTLRLV